MKTIIHVNRHIIKSNEKHNLNDPPLTVKTYKSNTPAYSVDILGPSRVVYSGNPLKCGAKAWIETESPVQINSKLDKICTQKCSLNNRKSKSIK